MKIRRSPLRPTPITRCALAAPRQAGVLPESAWRRVRLGAWALAGATLWAAAPSARADSAPGHDAKPARAATVAPAAGAEVTSMEALRQRLADKVAAVRAAQERPVPTASAGPAHGSAKAADPHAAPAPRAAMRHAAVSSGRAPAVAAHPAGDAHGGSAGHAAHSPHWSYAGEGGPAAWAQLKPEFATCGLGNRQSPIDIRGGIPVDLEAVKFDYKPAGFNVIDNGHTVQVNIGGGNAIEVGGRRYDLLQFHFHRPSEERINGRQFEMVAHLVHKDLEGRLAVVAVLLEAGRAHPIVQQVWNNLPLEKNEEQRAASAIDLTQLLPEDRRYYTYMGSLTTPPCSEGVRWLVMKQPVSVTPEQIGVFARLYANNARPVQPLAGRLIKESN